MIESIRFLKLEFGLCVRHGSGDYMLVSTVSYSSIIEDGHGPVSINSDVVQPQNLCAMGGQIIELPLSVDCPKRVSFIKDIFSIKSRETLNDTFFQLYVAKNTRDTFEFIVLNDPTFKNRNINKNQNELTDSDQEQLNSLVQKNIFALNRNEQLQTVFDLDDMSIYHYVDKYIDEINRMDPSLFPRLEDKTVSNVVQDWSTDMSIADISSSTNDLNSEIFVSPNNKIETHTWDNQIKQKIPQTNKHYTSNVISSLIQDSVQLNESNRVTQADQISVDTSSSILTHLSTTTGVPQIVLPQTSTQYSCKKPEIVTEPKQDWHPRYPKDLIPKPKNKVNKNPKVNPKYQRKTNKHINKKEQRKFIGLLQGVGGQRSHIQVKVTY
ncbi:unnamed protein product [Rotaria sordida]|uniref:Uncharacterized protein n=1 Tax=Rotaria sordida TaxID=392033 RepID=A0A818QVK3_9BILA|nr:unnamed protein product [Rotaria sordida]